MPVQAYFKGHGEEVMSAMMKHYGPKKGKSVFYATANARGMRPKTMHHGGIVPTGGLYELSGGELILPAEIADDVRAMVLKHAIGGRFRPTREKASSDSSGGRAAPAAGKNPHLTSRVIARRFYGGQGEEEQQMQGG